MTLKPNHIHQGDCVQLFSNVESGTIDLTFADPPFNIGYDYDVYDDRKAHNHYLDWSRQWISGVHKALKPDGTFWLAIGDEYAAELKLISQEVGFSCRSWVIWYYTFGVNCTRKFNRSHAHLFHFVKNSKRFTFNFSDPAIRVPSARQLVYADLRANPRGRLPDDTWILRPQDVANGFSEDQDTWYFPRVAGTFKERAGFHGCQMPEQLLGRIVRASSNEEDLVLDPFTGSGTTLTVAKKLGRRWIGFELSKEYARQAAKRIEGVTAGNPLEGAADPLASAPATPQRSGSPRRRSAVTISDDTKCQPARSRQTAAKLTGRDGKPYSENETPIVLAYLSARDGFSTDQLLADPDLNAAFVAACVREGAPGTPNEWNRSLLRLRKVGRLPKVEIRRRRWLTDSEIDPFAFASEIAWRCIELKKSIKSLDEIFCDPDAANEFDRIAARYAPGYTPFHYRWAAFWIRKRAKKFRKEASRIAASCANWRLTKLTAWSELNLNRLSAMPGIYIVRTESEKLYAGETLNLKARLEFDPGSIPFRDAIGVSIKEMPGATEIDLRGRQSMWIKRYNPELNCPLLAST